MKHLTVTYNKETSKLVYDRKLKDGPGNSMYGLEVCKSLKLPSAFLDRAHEIRRKYNKLNESILLKDGSRYNSKKVSIKCELCERESNEVHHLMPQKDANNNGYINSFHKNHLGNLLSVCEGCHDKIHNENLKYVKKRTSDGYELIKV